MRPALLNEALIRQQIQHDQPCIIDIFPCISSTIDWIRSQSLTAGWPRFCLAEEQTQGRGQRNRRWHTPFATNINLSFNWLFQKTIRQLEGLSLAIALCVVKTLAAYGITQSISIKWPNDIYWKNNKLAGILVETESDASGAIFTVISVGINVNMQDMPEGQITQPWTSLSLILGATQDRNKIAGLLINQLLADLALFNAQGFTPFLKDWPDYDYLKGKTVALKNAQSIYTGVVQGINARGHLLLCDAEGISTAYASGELIKSHLTL